MLSSIQKHAHTVLYLVLLPLVSVVSACSASTTNTATGNQLIVYVPGLNAHMSEQQTKENNGYGTDDSFFSKKEREDIALYLQGTKEFHNAQTMVYSYEGFSDEGRPNKDYCQDTYNNSLLSDVSYLDLQITAYLQAHQGTHVYLVSHSLGGVLVFAYLASKVEAARAAHHDNVQLVNGGVLQAAAILDSPLGGVTGGSTFFDFLVKELGIRNCPHQKLDNITVNDMQRIYNTASNTSHQGSNASILQVVYGQNKPNAEALSDAANLGVNILIAGNENDLLWQPAYCNDQFHTSFNLPDFLMTQYPVPSISSSAKGEVNVLWFSSGSTDCLPALSNNANHFDVLKNEDVKTAIWETFLGKPVTVLHSVPGVPNFAPFVGTWYAHAQQLVINADGKAIYTGRVFVWCVDYQGNTVNQPPCDGGGYQGINPNQNALITFNSVIGNTASGTIMPGGTGMRSQDDSRSLIPIGSTVTVTLNPSNNTLNVSNGMLLCGPQAIKNNVEPGCNSGA